MLNGTPTAISAAAAILAVLFSMAIGIIFGMLPSYKAANPVSYTHLTAEW